MQAEAQLCSEAGCGPEAFSGEERNTRGTSLWALPKTVLLPFLPCRALPGCPVSFTPLPTCCRAWGNRHRMTAHPKAVSAMSWLAVQRSFLRITQRLTPHGLQPNLLLKSRLTKAGSACPGPCPVSLECLQGWRSHHLSGGCPRAVPLLWERIFFFCISNLNFPCHNLCPLLPVLHLWTCEKSLPLFSITAFGSGWQQLGSPLTFFSPA